MQLTLKKEKHEEEGMKLELMLKRVQRYLSDSDQNSPEEAAMCCETCGALRGSNNDDPANRRSL